MAALPQSGDAAGWIAVGGIVKVHGLKGEVAVELLTDFPERFAPGATLQIRRAGGAGPIRIESARPHKGRLLVRFEGVMDATAAEALVGCDLCVLPADVPARPDDYFFHFELEGFEVVDAGGRVLGQAGELGGQPGLPLLSVRTPSGDRDVPFTYPILVAIDREARRIVLDPPEGLL